ncbi:MAG: tetratricopeptide repeat protein [Gemmatimonadota bacterium]|nr:MAG: tetratricopeptide repeat protein [Gemmatimonadota bacterium]
MWSLKRVIVEVHHRSIWQVLAVYLLGAAAGYQVVQSLTEGLSLPSWFPALAVILFIVLLPVVLATAVVREEKPDTGARGPEAKAADEAPDTAIERSAEIGPRVLTWRRALLGLVYVFALWGAIAAGWLALGKPPVPLTSDTELQALQTKLVVLPFENLGEPEDEYFADGLTEEISSRLAEIPELGVISRTSAIQYKDTEASIREIGLELGVQYVLEGTVRWERQAAGPGQPSRVRVTPQLIRVADDTNIWSERYDEVLADIFRVQTDIAENVARALDITLLEPQRSSLASRPTDNLEAYDLYLRGNDYYKERFLEENARRAIEMYEAAIELDPSFAQARAALARGRVWLHHQFGRTSELPRARAAVEEALQLAPDLAEAHMAMGDYHYYGRRDYEQALEHYVLVQRRQPSNADALALIAWAQRRQGEWERSLANAARALELDPRNTVTLIGQGMSHFYLGHYAEAEPYFLRAVELAPQVPYYHRWTAFLYLAWDGTTTRAERIVEEVDAFEPGMLLVGSETSWVLLDVFGEALAASLDRLDLEVPDVDSAYYYLARGQVSYQLGHAESARAYYDSARVVLETRVADSPGQFAPHSALGIAYAGLGRCADAIREGRRGVELLPVSRDAMTGPERIRELARIYVMCLEYDAAIEQLEYLLSVVAYVSPRLLRLDPFWRPLRGRPAFERLVSSGTW